MSLPSYFITHTVLNMGERAEDFDKHYLSALIKEQAVFDQNGDSNNIRVVILDTSKTPEASTLWRSDYTDKDGLEIRRLARQNQQTLFDGLKSKSSEIKYFVDSEGPIDFIKEVGGEKYIEDNRPPGISNFSVATERLRLSLYNLYLENTLLKESASNNPHVLWITDDDGSIRPSKSVNGELFFPQHYDPPIYKQIEALFINHQYVFSTSGFTGDLPAPLLTLDYNLLIIERLFESMADITNPDKTPNREELREFAECVLLSALEKLDEKYTTTLPINYSWWLGLSWKEIAKKLITIFCGELLGNTTPIKVATDDFPWKASIDVPFTNIVVNTDLMTLVPYFPPPFGGIRGSDATWHHTMRETLTSLKTETPVNVCYEQHPHFFHRQEVNKTRPSIGKWLAQRSKIYDQEGKPALMRGKVVTQAIFDDRIEKVIELVSQIPWLQDTVTTINRTFVSYKTSVTTDYATEQAKGEVKFIDSEARNKYAMLYIEKWRGLCKVLFPHVVERVENNLKINILNKNDAPIKVNLGFLKSTFRL